MSLKFDDVSSILEYGLESQNNVVALNKLATKRIRESNFSDLMGLLDELMFMAGDVDLRSLAEKESRIEELRGDLAKERMELLKEAKLMEALRYANDAYLLRIDEEIREAQDSLKSPSFLEALDAHSKTNVLKKRIYELNTTMAVAKSFSEQLKLSENNYVSMADRVWSVLNQLIPLLRGRISMETGKLTIAEARRQLRKHADAIEKMFGATPE